MSLPDAPPEADRLEGTPHPRHTPHLYGQEAAVADFAEALATDRMHHAWLLTGPRGVGKATLAWKLAAALLSAPTPDPGPALFGDAEAPPAPLDLDLPPDHPVRRRLIALSEPRFTLLRRPWDENAKRLRQEITVDEVRRMKSFFTMSATEGGRRVALIDAVDDLNTNAANALLKLLEEPPADVVMLLVCHQPARILPTILSRCRRLRLDTLGHDAMVPALAALGIDDTADAHALADLAGGSVGRAASLLQSDGLELYAALVALLSDLPSLDRPKLLSLADSAAGPGKEARFVLILDLLDLLLARMARAGVQGPPAIEAAPGEARLFARLSPDLRAARRWAEAQQHLGARARHGRAVNLDPAALILDMVLKISEEAAHLPAR